jgi:hypothetical protein
MKLIHGKADGDIEIINEQPHFVEGGAKLLTMCRQDTR